MASDQQLIKKGGFPDDSLVTDSGIGNLLNLLQFVRDGWQYKLDMKGSLVTWAGGKSEDTTPIYLTRGGGRYKMSLEDIGKQSWYLMANMIANNPFVTCRFRLDDWWFDLSPYQLWSLTLSPDYPQPRPNNFTAHLVFWQPMTSLGPMYSMAFDPVIPLPSARDISLEYYLPSSSLAKSAELLLTSFGRILINDYELFLGAYHRMVAEFKAGHVSKRW